MVKAQPRFDRIQIIPDDELVSDRTRRPQYELPVTCFSQVMKGTKQVQLSASLRLEVGQVKLLRLDRKTFRRFVHPFLIAKFIYHTLVEIRFVPVELTFVELGVSPTFSHVLSNSF